jgi:putative endonuclease
MEKQPCVYILASQRNGTLYIGVTSNLMKRSWEHKTALVNGIGYYQGETDQKVESCMESQTNRKKQPNMARFAGRNSVSSGFPTETFGNDTKE